LGGADRRSWIAISDRAATFRDRTVQCKSGEHDRLDLSPAENVKGKISRLQDFRRVRLGEDNSSCVPASVALTPIKRRGSK
jgi:hypothetical protein